MSTHEQQRTLLTVSGTAERLKVGESAVRRKIASGELPAVQLGGKRAAVRVDPADLAAWLYGPPRDAA